MSAHQYISTLCSSTFAKIALAVVIGMAIFGATMVAHPAKPAHAASADASVVSMIDSVFGADAPSALRIATCESGFNPNAVNPQPIGGSHASGVFQILYPSTWSGTSQAGQSPFNAHANIVAAHEIFVRDGHSWREWQCKP